MSSSQNSMHLVCASCGTENEPDWSFCQNCGTRLSPAAASPPPPPETPEPVPPKPDPAPMPPITAEPLSQAIIEQQSEPAPQISPPPAAPAPPSPSQKIEDQDPGDLSTRVVCSGCGAPQASGGLYCSTCGAPLVPGANARSREQVANPSAPPAMPTVPEQRAVSVPNDRPAAPPPAPVRGMETVVDQSMQRVATLQLISEGGQPGKKFTVDHDDFSIGRNEGDITFSHDGYMSGRHARIVIREGRFYLVDEGSRNGTFVRINEEIELKTGDTLLIGKQLFKFEEYS